VKTALLVTELLPVVGTGSNGPAALADVDGDGLPEIATFSAVGPIYLFDGQGRGFLGTTTRNTPVVFAQQPFGPGSNSVDSPTFGSLGGPALAELRGPGTGFHVVAPTTGLGKLIDSALPAMQAPADNHMSAFSLDRNIEEAFPRHTQDLQFFVVPVVADISGDGLPEILQGTGVRDLHAVDIDGAAPAGWPKFTAGWTVSPPAIADFDGDGRLEVAHVTREGFLFVWRTGGDECGYLPWPHGRHDAWGTSNDAIDAKAPGTARRVQMRSVDAGTVVFEVEDMPGDDLFCGPAAYDVRFSESPITAENFELANRPESIQQTSSGRHAGEVSVRDHRFVLAAFHFAMIARDEAGNRSPLIALGSVSFGDSTPTATATIEPTSTPEPTSTVVPTSTPQPTATERPTSTVPPTSTVRPTSTPVTPAPTSTSRGNGGDGCSIDSARQDGVGFLWLLPGLAVMLTRFRMRRRAGLQTRW
jgi:hypothetical protein